MASSLFSGFAGKVAATSIALGTGAFAISSCLFNVDAGHRGLIFSRFGGISDKVYAEGTHFYIPLLQDPIIYDVRTRPNLNNSRTGTKDLQTVKVGLRILCKPDVEHLPTIYKRIGLDYDERVLPSLTNEVLKSVVAQYNADQLLTLRDQVSAEICASLRRRCADFNILLDDVALTHLDFSREFSKAIEAKQVAHQESERSKFIVERTEQEKLAAIIQAEGESEAAKLISDSLSEFGDGVIEIRRIETAREVASTLARSRNVTYLPNSGVLFNIPAQ